MIGDTGYTGAPVEGAGWTHTCTDCGTAISGCYFCMDCNKQLCYNCHLTHVCKHKDRGVK